MRALLAVIIMFLGSIAAAETASVTDIQIQCAAANYTLANWSTSAVERRNYESRGNALVGAASSVSKGAPGATQALVDQTVVLLRTGVPGVWRHLNETVAACNR